MVPLSLAPFWMPATHVVRVGLQVRSRPEVVVVELQVQVVGLQVGQHEDAGDGTGELPAAVVDMLGHERNALFELFGVNLRARAHPGSLLPGPWRVGEEGSGSS